MKSKLLLSFIIAVLILCVSCLLEPEHTHTFSTKWSSDETHHWHAATCEHTEEIKDKATHKWDSGKITTEATHTTDGVMTYTCTICKYSKTETIPALVDAHTFSAEWSYDEEGHWHAITCSHTDAEIQKQNHTWDEGTVLTPATHIATGELQLTCTVCGQTKVEIIPADAEAHSFSEEWTFDETHHWHAATCEHTSICGSYEEHSWDNTSIIKDPTCSEDGIALLSCKCGTTKEVVVPATHTFSEEWTSDDDYHWHVAICEHTDQVSEKGEHIWDDGVTTPATHLKEGKTVFTCNVCGKQREETLPVIGEHTYSAEWSFDLTHHWHKASCGHDELITDQEEHTIDINGNCTVCTFVNTEGLFDITPEGVLTVKAGCKNMLPSILAIPSEVSEIEVKTIGAEAFKDCTFTEVVIPNTVTEIGAHAFYSCYSLENITIPESVSTLGALAFYQCNSLSSITIPKALTVFNREAEDGYYIYGAFSGYHGLIVFDEGTLMIPQYALWFADVSEVVIPNSVIELCEYSFLGSKLEAITIPDSVTSIGINAFRYCSLKEIIIPSSVKEIGDYAFGDCPYVSRIVVSDSITTLGSWIFMSTPGRVEFQEGTERIPNGLLSHSNISSVIIPDTVTAIGNNSFSYCSKLERITLPESLTEIGENAFSNCVKLKEITIPKNVRSIGGSAFLHCDLLSDISFTGSLLTIGDNAFTSCSSITNVYAPDITSWCNISFTDCPSNPMFYGENLYFGEELQSGTLEIPSGIKTIGDYAFVYCNSFNKLIISDSVTSIGKGSFYGCSSLIEVSISDSVISIGESAFAYCKGLTEITIPDSVSSIGVGVFEECSNLVSLTVPFLLESIENKLTGFERFFTTTEVSYSWNIPSSLRTLIISSATKIGTNAFNNTYFSSHGVSGFNVLTSIIIPETVTQIEAGAFSSCAGLTEIVIPDSVTSIEENTFYGCTGLTSITIPESVTSIGNYAFYGCTGLTSITIPESVTSVGKNAFYGCNPVLFVNNSDVPISYSFSSIVDKILGCPSELTVSKLYSSISSECFKNRTKLTTITIPDSVTRIYESTFYGCTNLTSITIPDSVTSINKDAFYNCTSLTSITIPDSVTRIEDFVFYGCTSLTSILFSGTQTQWASIHKGVAWVGLVPATVVHCSDGDVAL